MGTKSESGVFAGRQIAVTGKGSVRVKPDWIQISMRLESLDKEYARAMAKAADKIDSLTKSLKPAGFSEDDIRTSDFSVAAASEWRSTLGHGRNVDTGFKVSQAVHLGFGLDLEKLATVLAVISQWSDADPNLSVTFTVKDPAAVRDMVLESAAKTARRQAEALCRASGVQLGGLVRIDYSWAEININSSTRYYRDSKTVTRDMRQQALDREAVVKMRPDDISAQDTAIFVWEIE